MMSELMTTVETSAYLKISTSKLEKARMGLAEGPPFVRLGANVRYRKSDVDAWVSEHARP